MFKEIKNKHLLTWTGLDVNIVSENLPTHVMSTVKWHIKQERQHIRLTKKQPPPQKTKTAQEEK